LFKSARVSSSYAVRRRAVLKATRTDTVLNDGENKKGRGSPPRRIGRATDEDPEELLKYATDAAGRDVVGKEQAAEQVAKDLARMSRERVLPRVEILEKVSRYEAHLSRQLYKAMHELEALQTRRLGGSAPSARLDVDGLTES
jgi:hypothetical protein